MKYLIYTDLHWCTYSSIIRKRGEKYSERLENLIQSINWAEETALTQKCDAIICLGDFFDKPDLTSEQLSALPEITWAQLPHTFIIGNHDASTKDLMFNSVNALANLGFNLIKKPTYVKDGLIHMLYLPYLQDDVRKSIEEYREEFNVPEKEPLMVFSHNDVKGIQYGRIITKIGIDLEDIQNNCTLFLNGHIHNGNKIADNAYNLGNLTGKTLEEDGDKFPHNVAILDVTNTGYTLNFIENPYAFNFYNIEILKEEDFVKLKELKNNAVVSIKTKARLIASLKEYLDSCSNISNSRITQILELNLDDSDEELLKELRNEKDHLTQFRDFIITQLGESEAVMKEIERILLCG